MVWQRIYIWLLRYSHKEIKKVLSLSLYFSWSFLFCRHYDYWSWVLLSQKKPKCFYMSHACTGILLILSWRKPLSYKYFKVVGKGWFNKKFRSSHRRCSLRKCVLKNFAKLTGKHLCQSFFFNKTARLKPEILSKTLDSGTAVFLWI